MLSTTESVRAALKYTNDPLDDSDEKIGLYIAYQSRERKSYLKMDYYLRKFRYNHPEIKNIKNFVDYQKANSNILLSEINDWYV